MCKKYVKGTVDVGRKRHSGAAGHQRQQHSGTAAQLDSSTAGTAGKYIHQVYTMSFASVLHPASSRIVHAFSLAVEKAMTKG